MRVVSGPRTFQIKAGQKWAVKEYKGRLRVVMNRDNFTVRQAITPYDVLSVKQVRDLAAWLNRYLHMVAPTEHGEVLANARAHARGIDRGLTNLEANQTKESP